MNVLSLFDGISCGRIALEKAGIKVDKYFASEIKDIAIKVTQSNYPDTIQLGDVTKLDASTLPKIDLLIGGSPCQDFSLANRTVAGLEGEKSSLFYQYYRLLKELKPKYFLLENVRMKKADQAKLSELLGVEPIAINSNLVSAQNRPRLYWTNIPNITVPTDKGIVVNDILDSGYCPLEKARCLLVSDSRPLKTPVKMFHRFYAKAFTTLIFRNREHYEKCKDYYDTHFRGMAASDIVCSSPIFNDVRYLNKAERERLQTMPKGYCDILTDKEAADVLGDGWTVDVLAHIFSFIKEDDVEELTTGLQIIEV